MLDPRSRVRSYRLILIPNPSCIDPIRVRLSLLALRAVREGSMGLWIIVVMRMGMAPIPIIVVMRMGMGAIFIYLKSIFLHLMVPTQNCGSGVA